MNSTAPSEPRKNSHRNGLAPRELRVDRERCIGAGMCVLTAAGVFDQDDADGRVVALTTAPTAGQETAIRQAADMCPAGAIALLSR
ncbi:ferredoxin [Nocardia speluncae]|uniref:Ferredoxin n=1 Tax=Nocardia speluncae TaxID=419477 RepID=A0A846XR88_9NOCA|nr:ferredoxin [Nocardia speluncae]NKY37290.1 ferredoxin [Nocardia speluncae]